MGRKERVQADNLSQRNAHTADHLAAVYRVCGRYAGQEVAAGKKGGEGGRLRVRPSPNSVTRVKGLKAI